MSGAGGFLFVTVPANARDELLSVTDTVGTTDNVRFEVRCLTRTPLLVQVASRTSACTGAPTASPTMTPAPSTRPTTAAPTTAGPTMLGPTFGPTPTTGARMPAATQTMAEDSDGDDCAEWTANGWLLYCGTDYDDDDFTVQDMCCECGGVDGFVDTTGLTCSQNWCTSSDGGGGYQCWAVDGDPYSCSEGSADLTGASATTGWWPWTSTWYEYTCCTADACSSLSYCSDTDNSATNLDGDPCDEYYHNPEWCGPDYDDDDFTANDMCCVCGGGCGAYDDVYDDGNCPITRDFCENDDSLPDDCNCGDCGYDAAIGRCLRRRLRGVVRAGRIRR